MPPVAPTFINQLPDVTMEMGRMKESETSWHQNTKWQPEFWPNAETKKRSVRSKALPLNDGKTE